MIRLILLIFAVFTVNLCNAGTFTITPDINFGTVPLSFDVQPEITISNTGDDALQLGGIASTNTVAAPFRIIDTGCANSIIQPGNQCAFMVQFSPGSECGAPPLTSDPDYSTKMTIYNDCISLVPGELYTDSFNVEIVSDGISIPHEVLLSGQGGAAQVAPDIQVTFSSVNFGIVDVLENADSPYIFPPTGSFIPFIYIKNIGTSDLDISSVSVTGQDGADVTFQGECAVVLAPDMSCGILIEFKPIEPGIKVAAITIISDDTDEAKFDLLIRGTAAGEDDGVPADIEDAGPNYGDGNNDDILDSKQNNVATLIDSYGNYVTFLSENIFRFKDMAAFQQVEVPADFEIGSGIFDFRVEGLIPGESIEVGLILPAGMIPGAYYMYGPSPDNSIPHWYNFEFDGETGAIILGDVTFTASSGAKFSRSVLKVIYKDGGRGDSDLTTNGIIAATSAMPISQSSGESSASFNLLSIIFTYLVVSLLRRDTVINIKYLGLN